MAEQGQRRRELLTEKDRRAADDVLDSNNDYLVATGDGPSQDRPDTTSLAADPLSELHRYPSTPRPRPYPDSGTPPRPVDTGPQPRAYLAPGTPEAYREFARRTLGLHQVVPHHTGQMPFCSCGSAARLCAVLNNAHELLGHPVPWKPGDPEPQAWTPA